MKKFLIFFIISFCLLKVAFAQKGYNNWFFGNRAALNFATGAPVPIAGSNLVSPEGCSSISDNQGNLLFYTNGATIWNKNHTPMPNGSGLNGDPGSTQSVLITNHPGNPNLYYVFTTPKDGNPIGFQYSMVNMALNGGLGDVDLALGKNVSFNLPVCEKITAIKHQNGNDIWIITRRYESTQFVEYLIDCKGLLAFPSYYNAGSDINRPDNAGGYLKGSPDGKKLAAANFHGTIDLFDFDNVTGAITNAKVLYANPYFDCGPYGVEFSPDSKLLYVSQAFTCNTPNTYEIGQYQLDAPDITASKQIIETGSTNVAGALQLGPDNRIYIAYDQASFLGAITNPNVPGPGCTLVKPFVNLPAPALSGMGLPNIATGFSGYNRSLLGPDTVLCDKASYTLQLNIPATTYEWSDASTGDNLVVTASGQYWVKITHGSCVYRDTVNVMLQKTPVFSLGNDTVICQNRFPYQLSASVPGATYLWQDNSTKSNFSATGEGLYWLQASLNGCAARDSVQITASAVTPFNLGADTSVCASSPLTLTANVAASSYRWSTGSTSQSIVASTSGTYWCEAMNSTGCTYSDTIKVTVSPAPLVNLGKDTALCPANFPLKLSQSITGATYRWQDGSTNFSYSVLTDGLYWVEATVNGCAARDSIVVSKSIVENFSLGADTTICGSQPVTLTVSPDFAKYLWSNGSNTKTISVSASGLYWGEGTNGSGCTYRDTIRITYNAAPVVNLGKDTALCQNKFPFKLSQNIPGAAYLWQDGSTASSFTATAAGLYWLEATVNGCARRDSIQLSANAVDAFSLGGDTVICGNQPLTLTVLPDMAKYLWNTGSTSKSITINNSGLYWCEGTNASGCIYRDTINVAFNPASIVNLGNDTTICQDKLPITIGRNIGNASFLWQDGSTNPLYSVANPGLYWVQATVNGCSTRDSINIAVASSSPFSLGNDTSSCANQPVTLGTAQPFAKYLWSTGSTSGTITVINPGNYWLEATNNSGCSYRDTIGVSFKPAPVVNLGKDTSVCLDKLPVTIGQSISGATYLWQDGSTNAFYTARSAGLYWMQATVNGCSARDSIVVSAGNGTPFSLGNDTVICSTQPQILGTGANFNRYLWSTGSTNRNITVSTSGDYWLEAGFSSGCSFRDTIHVEFKSPPSFSLGPDTVICNKPDYLLDVSNTGDSYLWQDNSTRSQFLVTKSGSYHVVVSRQGCSVADSVTVLLKSKPAPDLGPDKVICPGEELTLTSSVAGSSFTWQDGSNDQTFRVKAPGRYTVAVANECGTGTDEIIIGNGSCKLMIPNAFTPGKNVNNTFGLINAFGLKEFSLQVFSRWGQRVFETTNSAEAWDGKYKGLDQSSGMYVYILSYKDDVAGKITQKGTVMLIR